MPFTMVESVMHVAIGCLAAALVFAGLIPFVHARAVRLTTRRLDQAAPLSMAQMQADKDRQSADFAVSARALEKNIELLKGKTAAHLSELARASNAIAVLNGQLTEKQTAIDELLRQQHELEAQLAQAQLRFSDKDAECTRLSGELGMRTATVETRDLQLAALQTELETLRSLVDKHKTRADQHQTAARESEMRYDKQCRQIDDINFELLEQRRKGVDLAGEVAALTQTVEHQHAENERLCDELELSREHNEYSRRERSHLQRELAALQQQDDGTAGERQPIIQAGSKGAIMPAGGNGGAAAPRPKQTERAPSLLSRLGLS
jgi:chromosome segregation ATPase